MPYSCQAQFGTSGSSGWPIGGGSTVRGIGAGRLQFSTLTIVQTATRASPGKRQLRPLDDRQVGRARAQAVAGLFRHGSSSWTSWKLL